MGKIVYQSLCGGLLLALTMVLPAPTQSSAPAEASLESLEEAASHQARRRRSPYRGGTGRREILS